MPSSILLPPSADPHALLDGIQRAMAADATLLLEPGPHASPSGFSRIQVGANGLRIGSTGPSPLPLASRVKKASIHRPDHAIPASNPDDNYGLFFIPTPPTAAEIAQATWKPYTDGTQTFEFAVVMRGTIEMTRLLIDCNMGNQGLENLAPHSAEHSAMLAFSGFRYPVPHTGVPRYMYVGFDSVSLAEMGFINGGFADDVWVTLAGGPFYPNINQVSIVNVESGPRVDPHRATISFSGLAQRITIQDARIVNLNAEQDYNWRNAPRQDSAFTKSIWQLQRITADSLNFAMFGKVMTLDASSLTASLFDISHAGGTIANSTLQTAVGERSRFFLLDGLHFDSVTWRLPVRGSTVDGITLACRSNDTCEVTFTQNSFVVTGKFSQGQIINSVYSRTETGNRVTATLSKCLFDRAMGTPVFPGTAVARVNERGTWTFDRADLGSRPLNQALPKGREADVRLIVK